MEATQANSDRRGHRGGQPLFGGHTGAEAGTSRYAPTWLLLVTRTLATVWLFGTLAYLCAAGRFWMQFLTNWTFAVLTLSFALLSLCSLLFLLGRVAAARALGQVAIPAHFVGATFALYIVPVYFAFLGRPPFDYGNLMPHALNLLPIVADFALGARYRFRAAHFLLALAYLALYVVDVWIRFAVWRNHPDYEWPYAFLDFQEQSPGITVAYYVGFFVWAAVAALVVYGASRLVACCEPRTEGEEKADDEVNTDAEQANRV